tara:strand:- start:209 stop:469 length:261 start_codon:yes stop_codon:yes gene_type:complete
MQKLKNFGIFMFYFTLGIVVHYFFILDYMMDIWTKGIYLIGSEGEYGVPFLIHHAMILCCVYPIENRFAQTVLGVFLIGYPFYYFY